MKKNHLPFTGLLFLLSVCSKAQAVHINKTDQIYHINSCHELKLGKTTMDLPDALANGYLACKLCRPAQDITENTLKRRHLDEKSDPETGSQPQQATQSESPQQIAKKPNKRKLK